MQKEEYEQKYIILLVLNFHTTYVGAGGEVVSDPKVNANTYFGMRINGNIFYMIKCE